VYSFSSNYRGCNFWPRTYISCQIIVRLLDLDITQTIQNLTENSPHWSRTTYPRFKNRYPLLAGVDVPRVDFCITYAALEPSNNI
jgi:hypothetical protein